MLGCFHVSDPDPQGEGRYRARAAWGEFLSKNALCEYIAKHINRYRSAPQVQPIALLADPMPSPGVISDGIALPCPSAQASPGSRGVGDVLDVCLATSSVLPVRRSSSHHSA